MGGYEPLLEFSHLKKQTLTKTKYHLIEDNEKMRYHCHKLAKDKDEYGFRIPLYGIRYDNYGGNYGQTFEEYVSDTDIHCSGRSINKHGKVTQSVNKFNQGIQTI